MSSSDETLSPRRWLLVLGRQVGRLPRQTVATLVRFFRNPINFVTTVVAVWILNTIIRPTALSIARAGEMAVSLVILVFLGGDGQLGGTGQLGLADVPILAATWLANSSGEIGGAVLATFEGFNTAIEAIGSQLGVFGPGFVFATQIALIAALLWLVWFVAISILDILDIPVIDLDGIVRTVLRPLAVVRDLLLEVLR